MLYQKDSAEVKMLALYIHYPTSSIPCTIYGPQDRRKLWALLDVAQQHPPPQIHNPYWSCATLQRLVIAYALWFLESFNNSLEISGNNPHSKAYAKWYNPSLSFKYTETLNMDRRAGESFPGPASCSPATNSQCRIELLCPSTELWGPSSQTKHLCG